MYQGMTSVVPDPTLVGSFTIHGTTYSFLPKASAQLPVLERSAMKERDTSTLELLYYRPDVPEYF